jgi:hypothetical protein
MAVSVYLASTTRSRLAAAAIVAQTLRNLYGLESDKKASSTRVSWRADTNEGYVFDLEEVSPKAEGTGKRTTLRRGTVIFHLDHHEFWCSGVEELGPRGCSEPSPWLEFEKRYPHRLGRILWLLGDEEDWIRTVPLLVQDVVKIDGSSHDTRNQGGAFVFNDRTALWEHLPDAAVVARVSRALKKAIAPLARALRGPAGERKVSLDSLWSTEVLAAEERGSGGGKLPRSRRRNKRKRDAEGVSETDGAEGPGGPGERRIKAHSNRRVVHSVDLGENYVAEKSSWVAAVERALKLAGSQVLVGRVYRGARYELSDAGFVKKLDRARDLFPVPNARVVDLRLGKERPRTKEDLFTVQGPWAFDPDPQGQVVVRAFLAAMFAPPAAAAAEQGDDEGDFRDDPFETPEQGALALAAFVRRKLGYLLTTQTDDGTWSFLSGENRADKLALCKLISAAMGPFCAPVPPGVVLLASSPSSSSAGRRGAGDATPHLESLRAQRVGILRNVPEGSRLNVPVVEALVEGTEQMSRGLYTHTFTATKSVARLLVLGTRPPAFDGACQKRSRQFESIPFDAGRDDDDEDYEEKEIRSHSVTPKQFFAFMVEAARDCLDWQGAAATKAPTPSRVAEASGRIVREMNPLVRFVETRCTLGAGHMEQKAVFSKALREFLEAPAERILPGTKKALKPSVLKRGLLDLGVVEYRTSKQRVWKGIGLN